VIQAERIRRRWLEEVDDVAILMGAFAEQCAGSYTFSREAQDAFGLASQEKYFAALEARKWAGEIAPVEILGGKQEKIYFSNDEQPRHSSMEKMAALRPAFIKDGSVTAGNSAGINDGAAAMLLARWWRVEELAHIVAGARKGWLAAIAYSGVMGMVIASPYPVICAPRPGRSSMEGSTDVDVGTGVGVGGRMAWQPLASSMRPQPRAFSVVLPPVKRLNALRRPVRATRRAMPRLQSRARRWSYRCIGRFAGPS